MSADLEDRGGTPAPCVLVTDLIVNPVNAGESLDRAVVQMVAVDPEAVGVARANDHGEGVLVEWRPSNQIVIQDLGLQVLVVLAGHDVVTSVGTGRLGHG